MGRTFRGTNDPVRWEACATRRASRMSAQTPGEKAAEIHELCDAIQKICPNEWDTALQDAYDRSGVSPLTTAQALRAVYAEIAAGSWRAS